MKIGENDINPFADESAAILGGLASKYFVIKKQFADGTMEIKDGGRIITGPPHDTNFMRAFEQKYNTTFADLETFLEVKDYFENEWNSHVHNILLEEYAKGAKKIKEPE